MSIGSLVVRTYLAEGALPVEGALVRVVSTDEGVVGEEHSRFTDVDGVTPEITLPAPLKALSTAPGAPEQPYYTYRVTVTKDGYYPKSVEEVAVFEGVMTALPVNMIARTDGGAPAGTLNSISSEPKNLE